MSRFTYYRDGDLLIVVYNRLLLVDKVRRIQKIGRFDWIDIDTLETDPFTFGLRIIDFQTLQYMYNGASND